MGTASSKSLSDVMRPLSSSLGGCMPGITSPADELPFKKEVWLSELFKPYVLLFWLNLKESIELCSIL